MKHIHQRSVLLFLTYCFTLSLWAGPAKTTEFIKVDQFGYFCSAKKVAVIADPQAGFNANESFAPGVGNNQYQVRRWDNDQIVFSGTLQVWNNGNTHSQSGDRGWWFDFSSVTTPGSYYIYDLVNQVGSFRFDIGDQVYDEVLRQAVRMFFYQRINFAKAPPYVDAKWADGAWYGGPNQDKAARSRYDKTNSATARDVSGGWFDAGDPNKYTTFTFDPMLNMLEAYRLNPTVFKDNYNIPESGNGIPDLLDELKWELDWLKRMQDATGTNGFMIKVGVDNFNEVPALPSLDTRPRYWVGECTSATLTGAAIFACAGQVYKSLSNPTLQAYGQDLIDRAVKAWARALVTTQNLTTFETACDDQNITSGDADRTAAEQLGNAVAAAIYLLEATGNNSYKTSIDAHYDKIRPVNETYWSPYNMSVAFALLKYASMPNATLAAVSKIRSQKAGMNNVFSINHYQNRSDLYRAFMEDWAHHWGSNNIRSNSGLLNLDFIHFGINTPQHTLYQETAEQYLHWLHGVNPLTMVMLSNMYGHGGEKCVNELYHHWYKDKSDWDNALTSPKGPPPGYVTGGPNKDFSVKTISPPASQPPQKSYKDWNFSWPENSWEISEPAIYYQAAYVALLSRIIGAGSNCSPATALPELARLEERMQVFPQPARGAFTLQYEAVEASACRLSLRDVQGRLLWGKNWQVQPGDNRYEMENLDLPAGLYVLELRTGSSVGVKRVVVQ